MSERTVELVYFDGCPNVDEARKRLRSALGQMSWREWNLSAEETPERFRRYGSPTVLVDGRDVTGEGDGSEAMSCRADGPPATEVLRDALGDGG